MRSRAAFLRNASLFAALAATSAVAIRGQVTTGSIVGIIRDASGAVAPNVQIEVRDQRTNSVRTVTSGERGDYFVSALPPSEYTIRAESPGFKTYIARDIVLPVGAELRVDVLLEVGDVTEQVTVEAAAPLLESETAALTHVVDQRKILNLPLNGRNFLELAALSAGASPKTPFRTTQFGNRNQYVTIGGGRDSSTNYLIDGVEARSLRFNNSSIQPSVDAIQEFKVERNSFSAEYGRGVAVVNTAIKSGTNQFHGTLYEFFRNDDLDAKNFFDATKPAFTQNQYGYSWGGPLLHDRTFFFTNYEGLRSRRGRTFLATVPDRAQLMGDFSSLGRPIYDPETTVRTESGITRQPFENNRIPADRIHTFAESVNQEIWPAPNNGSGALNYRAVAADADTVDQFNGRVDHRFSEADTIFGRYTWYDGNQLIAGPFQSQPRPQSGHNATLQHLHIFSPKVLNQLRLGYNRAVHFTKPLPFFGDRNIAADLGVRNLGGTIKPSLYGIPAISISGFSNPGENTLNQGSIENVISLSDKITMTYGRHTVKLGAEYQNVRYQQQGEVSPRGNFTFTGVFSSPQATSAGGVPLADYLLGLPLSAQGGVGDATFNLRSYGMAFFLEDSLRVSDRLTLNVGVRWQYDQPVREADYKEAVFAEDLGLIAYSKEPTDQIYPQLLGTFVPGSSVRHGINDPDYNNFSPRVGIAWRPMGDKTVIRTGFGVFYDNINGNEWQFMGLIPPFYSIITVVNTADFPSLTMSDMFPTPDQFTSIPAPFSTFRRDRTPYTLQWNFSVQRRLSRNTALEVAYAGSGSHKLWKRFNQNQAVPDPTGLIPIEQRVPFPQFQAGLLTSGRDANSVYNSASVKLEHSYSNGFNYQTVYTFSRNIDNNSGEFEANQTRFRWDKRADRGLSRYHQKHRFVANAGYELPFGRGKALLGDARGAVNALVGGWQVFGIVTLSTGFPFTPSAGSVHNTGSFVPQFADRIADGNLSRDEREYTRWFDTEAFASPAVGTLGTSGRNVLIGPGVGNLDLSFMKNTVITERLTLQFRTEFFNLTNNALFAEPNTNVDSPAFGAISQAADARTLQFGLKLIF